jgi:hypothetical protein
MLNLLDFINLISDGVQIMIQLSSGLLPNFMMAQLQMQDTLVDHTQLTLEILTRVMESHHWSKTLQKQ